MPRELEREMERGGGGRDGTDSCFRRTVGKRRISADGRKFGVMYGDK